METTKSKIVAALRNLWLRSGERAECLKKQHYTCQRCGIKKTNTKEKVVKVQVHHKEGVLNWDDIVREIRKNLLCDVDKLECLCVECHKKEK